MAHWKKRFPSKYLQASDLDEGPIDVTIKGAPEDEVIGTGDRAEEKPVLFFREKGTKGVVLNMTKGEAIEQIAGTPEEEKWAGVRIRLQKGRTKYQGKTVACIEIVAAPAPSAKRPPAAKAAPTAPEPDDPIPTADEDGEEPF